MGALIELLNYIDRFTTRELGNKKDDYAELARLANAVRDIIEQGRCSDGADM